jgi:hypothetical protein
MTRPTRTTDRTETTAEPVTRREALTRALATTGLGTLAVGTLLAGQATAQSPRQRRAFPRIARALDEMQATKELLENSPKRFGGYKAKAITALEVAIVDLKLALQYADS